MSIVSENIKYLRKQKGFTQEQLAEKLGIKRSLIGAYEEGRADPPIDNLQKLSKTFQISVDRLISVDVKTGGLEDIPSSSGAQGQFKVLAVTVDSQDRENIELVPQKASAGYLNGFADPEYLEELPKFHLPMLPKGATYRAFEINGDSMLPLVSGTIVIGKYIENSKEIKNGKTYILVTKQEGVVYKRVFNYIQEHKKLYLVSDNKTYSAYDVSIEDVLEIWEAKAFISVTFPDQSDAHEITLDKLAGIVLELQQEVIKLKGK